MFEHEFKKDVIYTQLKEQILSGVYPSDFKLPGEREFCKNFGVSIITLRSALKKLEDEGFLIRCPAKGTFIAPNKNKRKGAKEHVFVIMSEYCEFASPNPYILQGIRDAIYKSNKEIILCGMEYINSQADMGLNQNLKNKNVSGIICMANGFRGDEPVLKTLRDSNLPVIIPHGAPNDYKKTGFAVLTVDYRKSWSDALEYLSKKGHERIASLVLRKDDIRGHKFNEHIRLLEKYGLNTEHSLTRECSYIDKASIKKTVEHWLASNNPPSAIMCFSDFLAIDVYDTLKQMHINIPENIAVMGCCGYPGAAFMNPTLSTVDYEYYKTGQMAIEVLNKSNDWFYKENAVRPLIIKNHCIVERESTSMLRLEKGMKSNYEASIL